MYESYRPYGVPQQILRAAIEAEIGQIQCNPEAVDSAVQFYRDILGQNKQFLNTVPGREIHMAVQFLQNKYADSLKTLETLEEFIGDEDEYSYNKGMLLGGLSRWAEAARFLDQVKSPEYRREFAFCAMLAKCYIKTQRPGAAWELYPTMKTNEEAKQLLMIVASECYLSGQYYVAMKAYDTLSKAEADSSLREGAVFSAVAVFKKILARTETGDKLRDVLDVITSENDYPEIQEPILNYVGDNGML